MDTGLEIWGGIECTVNRVGDRYFDQVEFSGHARRNDDLELLRGLGIKKLRYPVLWERVAPQGIRKANWEWTDERLDTLRRLGIEPIVGLLHHGSGPRYTSLLDEAFPQKLAEFAAAVAKRYPWIRLFSPVNEPLTTARFSALYGLWYPHEQNTSSFLRALLIQCRAVVQAMEAIREVSPHALLVQTEDLGKTHSTPELYYQADFENARRWFSIDLLTGNAERNAPMVDYCARHGIEISMWRRYMPRPCVPDILGFNYYVTSERYIDHRIENYAVHTHGGNERDRYADVEAVRVCIEGVEGVGQQVAEAWERFHLPLAITECHINSTREEQVRWLHDTYRQAVDLKARGIDIRAVTAWSLFGAYDWMHLVTRQDGIYESGAFDLRSPTPRKTAVADAIAALGRDGTTHPVLDVEGWWRRPGRFAFPPVFRESGAELRFGLREKRRPPRRLLITSGATLLGEALIRHCELRGLEAVVLEADRTLAGESQLHQIFDDVRPWAAVNSLELSDIDEAENARLPAFELLCEVPLKLATLCEERGIPLLTFSSSHVFDGGKPDPYIESDRTNALNFYGQAKVRVEKAIMQVCAGSLICRCDILFARTGRTDIFNGVIERLSAQQSVDVPSDATCSPAFVEDVGHAALDLLIDGEHGIWHLSHGSSMDFAHFIALLAQHCGVAAYAMRPRPLAEMDYAAARPSNTALFSERGQLLPTLEHALKRVTDHNAVLR